MKLTIKLEINRVDTDAPKGEDFDRELEDAVAGLDVEGWEVNNAKIQILRDGDTPASYGDVIVDLMETARDISIRGKENPISAMSSMSPAEHVSFLIDEALMRIKAFEKKK